MFEQRRSTRKKSKKPDLETLGKLYQKYVAEEYTSKDIAEMYGVNPATVRMWFSNARKDEEAAREREMNE